LRKWFIGFRKTGFFKELIQIEEPIGGFICLIQGTIDTREPRLNEKAMPRYSELEIDHGHHPSCDKDPPELGHKPHKSLAMNPAMVGCRMRCEELFTTLVQASTGPVPSEDMQEEAAEEVKMTSK
jgi:hypothetical protein